MNIPCTDEESVAKRYATCTFATKQKILGIVLPETVDQVVQITKLANRLKVQIYPISSGKNWGYGSAVPSTTNCVVVDLSNLNRIVTYDEKLAYIRVQAGTTFQQVYEFLEEKKSPLMLNPIGSTSSCSLIGNVLERGVGFGVYGNRFEHVSSLDVILADGRLVKTGHRRFKDDATADIFKHGLGAQLEGLFFQSNLGIVTEMTFYLTPKQKYLQTYRFKILSDEKLPSVIDVLTKLRLNGIIRKNFGIANDYKVLVNTRQFPWNVTQGKVPLPAQVREQMKSELRAGRWNGGGAISSNYKGHLEEVKKILFEELGPVVDELTFLDGRQFESQKNKDGSSKSHRGVDERRESQYQLLHGVYDGKPSNMFVQQLTGRIFLYHYQS